MSGVQVPPPLPFPLVRIPDRPPASLNAWRGFSAFPGLHADGFGWKIAVLTRLFRNTVGTESSRNLPGHKKGKSRMPFVLAAWSAACVGALPGNPIGNLEKETGLLRCYVCEMEVSFQIFIVEGVLTEIYFLETMLIHGSHRG